VPIRTRGPKKRPRWVSCFGDGESKNGAEPSTSHALEDDTRYCVKVSRGRSKLGRWRTGLFRSEATNVSVESMDAADLLTNEGPAQNTSKSNLELLRELLSPAFLLEAILVQVGGTNESCNGNVMSLFQTLTHFELYLGEILLKLLQQHPGTLL
jgi:hypothetical protein